MERDAETSGQTWQSRPFVKRLDVTIIDWELHEGTGVFLETLGKKK